MTWAVREAAAAGAQRILLRGSDSPTLDAEVVREALAALREFDLVLRPDYDGGYSLVGLRRPAAGLFDHPMSTPVGPRGHPRQRRPARPAHLASRRRASTSTPRRTSTAWPPRAVTGGSPRCAPDPGLPRRQRPVARALGQAPPIPGRELPEVAPGVLERPAGSARGEGPLLRSRFDPPPARAAVPTKSPIQQVPGSSAGPALLGRSLAPKSPLVQEADPDFSLGTSLAFTYTDARRRSRAVVSARGMLAVLSSHSRGVDAAESGGPE